MDNEKETPDIDKLKVFVAEYEKYFSQETSPLLLEPEMLDGYVKRNKLTEEQREFLMQRPHYIYASQAMDILTGKFNIDDYYLIRNSDYYTKPLSKFLPAEILKTKVLDNIKEFRHLQQAKMERNIYDVNILDAHGSIESGYTRVPDGITLCFTTQPFHVGTGDVKQLIYQLQNTDVIKPLITHPACYGKYSINDTFRHMIVYYPGQMVPNMDFSPAVKPETPLYNTMGYYSASDIAKKPVTYDNNTNKYELNRTKTPFFPMRIGKQHTISTEIAYKSFSIEEFMNGTSYVGPISGVVIIDSCRNNEEMTSYEHESLNRYETFISMLNFIVGECATKNKLMLENSHGGASTNYLKYLKYYDNIAINHIPMFDYRLLPDYMFDILTYGILFDKAKLKHSLVRRAFKIKELIDTYTGNVGQKSIHRQYRAEQLAENFNKVSVLADSMGYNNTGADSLVRRITALIELEHDAEAVKLVAIYMDNDTIDPNHKLSKAEIGKLLYSWIDTKSSKHTRPISGNKLYDIYYSHLSNVLTAAVEHKCILTASYIL
jgi:hypothetical protein